MNPYHVLGLPPSATKEEVKTAFRKHALQHHPDQHVNSSEATRKQAEATFKAIKAAYEEIIDTNFNYKASNSPGRAGFRRSASSNQGGHYSSSYYNPGSDFRNSSSEYYNRYGRHHKYGFSAAHKTASMADLRYHWRAFRSSGSAALSAALAGLFLGGILFLEPVFSSAWDRNNQGKLFKDLENEVLARRKLKQQKVQALHSSNSNKQDPKHLSTNKSNIQINNNNTATIDDGVAVVAVGSEHQAQGQES